MTCPLLDAFLLDICGNSNIFLYCFLGFFHGRKKCSVALTGSQTILSPFSHENLFNFPNIFSVNMSNAFGSEVC